MFCSSNFILLSDFVSLLCSFAFHLEVSIHLLLLVMVLIYFPSQSNVSGFCDSSMILGSSFVLFGALSISSLFFMITVCWVLCGHG